ncbi:MAG: hypothetical protein CMK44_01490 [Porticoccus sp.]|nr:hypothetical protein [Porticoccus sp.]
MAKKTIRKYNFKNKKKKTKKYVRNKSSIFSKSELNNINKIISQLDEDITYLLRGSKREIKKKKKKLFNDFKILKAKRKGQRGGGWKGTTLKVTGAVVGFAFLILLGLDTFMDLRHIFPDDIYEHMWVPDHQNAKKMFPMMIRMAARPIFGAITRKILSHMGCDRYVKQDLTQEQCDAKNRSYIEMGDNIKSLQLPITMLCLFGSMSMTTTPQVAPKG